MTQAQAREKEYKIYSRYLELKEKYPGLSDIIIASRLSVRPQYLSVIKARNK